MYDILVKGLHKGHHYNTVCLAVTKKAVMGSVFLDPMSRVFVGVCIHLVLLWSPYPDAVW